MGPGTVIIEQKTYLTYQPSTEDKGGKYFLTLILRDKKGHEYVFISKPHMHRMNQEKHTLIYQTHRQQILIIDEQSTTNRNT